MIRILYSDFEDIYDHLRGLFASQEITSPVDVGEWHSQKVEGAQFLTHELRNVVFETPIPETVQDLVLDVEPQMPWAEDHFQERVSGNPYNPPPSAEKWLKEGMADKHRTIEEGGVMKYSHTYPERFWPKMAGRYHTLPEYAKGIRFDYGDLQDVVNLFKKSPLTRQAYLPVWFPEDTGAVHGERVPCSLGYHFLIREGKLHVTYIIRSVDFVRHFRDDLYMAARLGQWMCWQTGDGDGFNNLAEPGSLTMLTMSLHCFEGDMAKLRREHSENH